jgi:group I intron endonuclease
LLIYKATNRINGKSYIGQTVNGLKRRRQRHVSDSLSDNRDSGSYFHRSILKYGEESFDWEILIKGDFTIKVLNRLEIHFISFYNTYIDGYNLTKGGNGSVGHSPSKETRRKISEANRGKNHPMYGKHKSGKDAPNVRSVIINNKYFGTRKEAADYLNVDPATVRNRIKRQVPGYRYA